MQRKLHRNTVSSSSEMMVGSEWAQRESALPYSFPATWEDNEMVPAGSKNQLTDISEKSFRLVNSAGQ